jgi:glycerophosphoryl diester phosphodiesterase
LTQTTSFLLYLVETSHGFGEVSFFSPRPLDAGTFKLMSTLFELQGHRGARGLRPENTLPSFEIALDVGVAALETDLHLTQDGVVVVCHDPRLSGRLCGQLPFPEGTPLSLLTAAQLRTCRVDRNPDPQRFPEQRAEVTPVAALFARANNVDPFGIPTLVDLFAFIDAYSGASGAAAGKSDEQRRRASQVHFDLELKRVPFYPEAIGDEFQGEAAGLLERQVVAAVITAGVVERTRVRCFDHRAVRALRQLEPRIAGAVLIAETAPVDPVEIARRADADVYCPNYLFLDVDQVRRVHAGGVRILPWTANDATVWERLLAWGVDGITTDYPDRLAAFLQQHGVAF